MADPAPIQWWHWAGFVLMMFALVGLDLGVFHRSPGVVKAREALLWSGIWFLLAMFFAGLLAQWRSPDESLQFLSGYLIESSLSLDNVLAMAVIFTSFGVAAEDQHRVLYWGILGALLMRGLMICTGAALLSSFHWLIYLMGLFLVVTGARWIFSKSSTTQPSHEIPVVRLARRIFPISGDFDGGRFVTTSGGRLVLTPLALVLLAIETSDLIFAVDSVPAVLGVTQNAFIVFTSNMFAVLGLRSLYFVLARAIGTFKYLRQGLAAVLVVVGLKMFVTQWVVVPSGLFLAVVLVIVALAIGCSLLAARRSPPSGSD